MDRLYWIDRFHWTYSLLLLGSLLSNEGVEEEGAWLNESVWGREERAWRHWTAKLEPCWLVSVWFRRERV